MKPYLTLCLSALLLVAVSCEKPNPEDDQPQSAANIIRNAVKDIDGNTYDAVKIGGKVWMAEDLRTQTLANGQKLSYGPDCKSNYSYYYPDNDINNVPTYGLLYTFTAATGITNSTQSSSAVPSGIQGICPNGWHIPSKAEWELLFSSISSVPQFCCNGNPDYIAKAMASATGWATNVISDPDSACWVGVNQSLNNASGFNAMPAGSVSLIRPDSAMNFGYHAQFWSCSIEPNYPDQADIVWFNYQSPNVIRMPYVFNGTAMSVRCVQN